MPERKTPQPPRFVPPPPGSTPVVEGVAKPVEVLTKRQRPPRTTPTYGVPIVKPEESADMPAEPNGETGEIEEADMVAGEIEVRARTTEISAPTSTVVVDPTPRVALAAKDARGQQRARKPGGATMPMALGVGGLAIVALAAWKILAGGDEGPSTSTQAASRIARSTPAAERPATGSVAMSPPSPATAEKTGDGTARAATGADDPAGDAWPAMSSEAQASPPEQDTPPSPEDAAEPKSAAAQPDERREPKKKRERKKKRQRKPGRSPATGRDPPPAPPPAPETPAPRPKASAKEDAKQLLAQARKNSMKGLYGKAWHLASESYALAKNVAALQVMGVAACKMGDRAKASKAHRLLPAAKRPSLSSVCSNNGITLD